MNSEADRATTTVMPPPAAPDAGPRGLFGRLLGVVVSPRAAYADIAARPSWLGALLVILVVTVVPLHVLLSTEIGQRAALDRQLETVESFGGTVSDALYRQMREMAPYSGYIAAAGQIVWLPAVTLVIAGIAFAVFDGRAGTRATFAQVFSIVAFSHVLRAVRALYSTPLSYARESLSSPTSLAAALPLFADDTFGARLLGSIDLFVVWWIVNLAIGLGVLYKRRTAPIALTMLGVYGAIGLAMAAVRSVLSGA